MLLQPTNIDLLEELVRIDSQSRNQQGVRNVQYLLTGYLEQMGFVVEKIAHPESAPLLNGTIGDKGPLITLISHADTVIPADKSPFRIEGDRALGAGIADNKAGVFIALTAMQIYLKNCEENHLRFQFANSPTEEIGSPGFHPTFKEMGLKSDYAFGFEPALEDGGLIKSRNGNKWIKLTVKGKAFHAGRAHKGHINAAQDLIQVLAHLHAKVQNDPTVTFNIGQIGGGHSYNTICEEATVKIDTRFRCLNGVDKIQNLIKEDLSAHFHACSETQIKSKYSIEIEDFCPPLAETVMSPCLESYRAKIGELEAEAPVMYHCGGAADINHFYHQDLIALDGCGAVGGNLHRVDEYVIIDSLRTRAQAFANFLLGLNEKERYGTH